MLVKWRGTRGCPLGEFRPCYVCGRFAIQPPVDRVGCQLSSEFHTLAQCMASRCCWRRFR